MDKDAENMDEMSISPAFSMNSVTSETTDQFFDQALADLDEPMLWDEVLENKKDTCSRIDSNREESEITFPSSRCSSLDSDISDMVTPMVIPYDQNVDETITNVCHSYLYPENLETEADELTKTLEVTEPTKTLEVTEPTKTLEVTEPTKTLEVTEPTKTLEVTEPAETLEVTEPAETLAVTEPTKTLEVTEPAETQWKRCFSRWQKKRTQPFPLEHLDAAVRSDLISRRAGESKQGSLCSQVTPSNTSYRAALRSTPLEMVDYMEDQETFRQSSVDESQTDSDCLSNNQIDVMETKTKGSNHFCSFFHNIFSKKEKKEKALTGSLTKQPPFWMQLLCCSCLDK